MPDNAQQRIAEILKRVQRIQIIANRTVDDLFAGHYKSVFRGQGMEFDEVRQYQPGDDIRSIDWNVTARSGDCFVKRYSEERELTVQFVVDISASGLFGSQRSAKLDVAIETAALLMFSALKNSDKVGLITFGRQVEEYLPPRKGKAHVLHLIRELIDVHPADGETDMRGALEFLNRVQKRRAVVFLISDFLVDLPRPTLAITNRRHDLTAITVTDPRERELPNVGMITLRDAETGAVVQVDAGNGRVRQRFAQLARQRHEDLARHLARLSIDQLPIDTHGDHQAALRRFFRLRERRFRA
jgi:uncharacterized protein (DUF58 family)